MVGQLIGHGDRGEGSARVRWIPANVAGGRGNGWRPRWSFADGDRISLPLGHNRGTPIENQGKLAQVSLRVGASAKRPLDGLFTSRRGSSRTT